MSDDYDHVSKDFNKIYLFIDAKISKSIFMQA